MKISLITVSFNSGETIRSTLDSIAAQNYPELEYILVDGGSKDDTLDIVRAYSDLVTECISEPDSGIYDAMNKGVLHATGEIVGILNSDDFYLHGEVLREVSALFASDPQLEVVLGDVDFVHEDNLNQPVRNYRTGNFKPWMFRFGLMPPHPAVFVRKSAYERVGLYKLGYKIAADFDFLVRLLLVDGAKYQIAHKTWVRMRTGGVSTSGLKSNILSTQEMKRSLIENGLFSSGMLLMFRLPYKVITQIIGK
ncbi:glycosyltransferase family 2 protein [Nitrincola lacisaponensis]|uniref:glycosyltransferase family 2 protein n=1 Tax=Nitrincola lacisaponensis TaxID=267850 RepID=UPI000568AAA0|nr:glycosyltransferase family 2 protein [Nitrincola lacisaponensis]